MKKILAISGSTRKDSSNEKLLKYIAGYLPEYIFHFYEGIDILPHFNPDESINNPPQKVLEFRELIHNADGVIICTPEYVFSLPGSLKNALEWTVATTLFSNKPTALITASASGIKGHEELCLVMQTLEAQFTDDTQLVISGIRGKFDANGNLNDIETVNRLEHLINSFEKLVTE